MKALIAWLVLGSAALADVQVTLHVIEMPQSRAAELVAGDEDGDVLFMKARGLVKGGQAQLFDTQVMRVTKDRRAAVESNHEHISPSESEPGGLGSTTPPQPLTALRVQVPQLRLPLVPPAFETRNVGATFEVEATAAEGLVDTPPAGGLVDLHGSWQFVILAGETVFDDWTDELGTRNKLSTPVYVSFNATFTCTLSSGKWALVSVQNGCDASGKIDPAKKLAVFVKADDLHPAK